MPRTSDKSERILSFVNEFVQENGFAPSVREIGAAVGLRSTASVSYHLNQLQEKGLLQSPGAKGRKRAIVTARRPRTDDNGSNGPGNRYLQHAHCPVSTVPRQFVSIAAHGLA